MNEKRLNARAAWIGLAAGVLVYDAISPDNQTLSEGVDRALLTHPKATMTAIGLTALHLANMIPEKVDPLHQISIATRRLVHA